MKILVCISHVLITTSKLINGDSELTPMYVQYVINPNIEFGLTRAIWFQENNKEQIVTVVNVGGPETELFKSA
jgi:electron transfer flavoprotein beta subunit